MMKKIASFISMLLVSSLSLVSAQQTQFFRTYSMGLYDVAEEVIPIADTNYIAVGTTQTGGINGPNLLIFQTTSTGQLSWWKDIGGIGIENGKAVTRALDSSGYFIAGLRNNLDSSGYDVLLVKTDLNGNLAWSKTFGGTNWEMSHSIASFQDSTYLIAGETFSFGAGQKDVYLIKVNSNGDTIWTKTFGGPDNDYANYVMIDRYNNALVIGSTQSFGAGNYDAYFIYLDANGDTIWTKTVGTSEDDFGYSVDMNVDINNTMSFIIGYTSYYAPDLAQNSYLLKIDSLGNSISTFPQMEANAEILDHIKVKSVGPERAVFTADIKYAYNEIAIIYMLRMTNGFTPWIQNTYGSGGNEGSYPTQIIQTLDRGFIISGYCENWGPGPTSAFLLKTDSMTFGPNTPVMGIELHSKDDLQIFPNPVEGGYFFINATSEIKSVTLTNLTGQIVKEYSIIQHQQSLVLDNPGLTSGIYIVSVTTNNGSYQRKIKF